MILYTLSILKDMVFYTSENNIILYPLYSFCYDTPRTVVTPSNTRN